MTLLEQQFVEQLREALRAGNAPLLAAACLAMAADGEIFIADQTLHNVAASRIEVARDPNRYGTVIRIAGPSCPHGDATCPCQDGDTCHYEGDDPMRCPRCPDVPAGWCNCREVAERR